MSPTSGDEPVFPDRVLRRPVARRRALAAGSAAVLASGAAAMVVGSAGVASADGFSVTSCTDTGAGSLRQAIADANAHDGADTITITATCSGAGAVAVGSALEVTSLNAADSLSIVGPGADAFVLDGGHGTRILNVTGDADFSLSGVTLQHARTTGFGAFNGGGAFLRVFGDVTIAGVVFADNATPDGSAGGAMVMYASSLTVVDSTFVGNEAYGSAGGLYLYHLGEVTISSSTFTDNSAGRTGGAIAGYARVGDVGIYNTTITGNTAGSDGGGIAALFYYGFSLVFSTVADNTSGAFGGGLYIPVEVDDLEIVGSIVAGNSAAYPGTDEISSNAGSVTEHDNLFEGTVGGFTPDATDLTGVDPLLGPLADNGGPTQTRALGAGSPAIDAGPVSFPPFPGDTSDQRGTPWSRVYGGRSDIGALEVQPEPVPGPVPGPDPVPTFTG